MFNSNVYYMYHTRVVQEGTHEIEIINLKSLVSKKNPSLWKNITIPSHDRQPKKISRKNAS